MVLVLASIGLEELLGTEALQSCLHHQLDLRMGQLWVDGQSTLQLHQQRQAARASAHLTNSLVLLPDSEIVAPVSIRSPSGIQPGWCSLIEPNIAITENYGVLVGRILVDTSEWSASLPVCICMYVCMYVCMNVCMYVRTYVRTYVRIYMYIYTYIYI